MDNHLSVKRYDENETKAISNIPSLRIVQACVPVMFVSESIPCRVTEERELLRFLNTMHEGNTDLYLETYGLLEEELDLFLEAYARLLRLSEERYGRAEASVPSLLTAIYELRFLKAILPSHGTVLEIGSGSGYLCALLAMHGYSCVSTDVTQGFYLVQNHVYHRFASKVIELAVEERGMEDVLHLEPGTVLHVPWYKYLRTGPKLKFHISAAIANNMLAEMHPYAMQYNFKFWSELLACPDRPQFLFANGLGQDLPASRDRVEKARREHRFAIAFSHSYTAGYVSMENTLYLAYLQRHGTAKDRPTFSRDNPLLWKIDQMVEASTRAGRVSKDRLLAALEDRFSVRDYRTSGDVFFEYINSPRRN